MTDTLSPELLAHLRKEAAYTRDISGQSTIGMCPATLCRILDALDAERRRRIEAEENDKVSREFLEVERRRVEALERAIQSAILRCEEGDPTVNWVPIIRNILRRGLESVKPVQILGSNGPALEGQEP